MALIPKKPNGDSPESVFLRAVWEELWGRKTIPFVPPAQTVQAASSPAVTIGSFQFIKSWGDYVIGQNTSGVMVQIAKCYKHRNSISSEIIDGSKWTITYPQNPTGTNPPTNALAYVSRTKTNGSYTENQRITPPWLPASNTSAGIQASDSFYAVQLPYTVAHSEAADTSTPAGTAITWLDLNLDGRAWAATSDGNV